MTIKPGLRWLLSITVALAAGVGFWLIQRRTPMDETQIFQGVWYGCVELAPGEGGSGLMHYVRVDLTAPGIELYVSPVDPEATKDGKQYRLRHTAAVADRLDLAVAVNGAPFRAHARVHPKLPIPGDLADWMTMSVSAGQVSEHYPHSYMLWFERDLTPHLEFRKPPRQDVLERAYWGVSGEQVLIYDGQVRGGSGDLHARTLIGINRHTRELYLAVFENCSHARGSVELARLGVTDAIFLDGGPSTSLVIGDHARHARPGTVLGGWRPVATHFGVRALPLE